ncbi:PD-(D/E)XK nuclease domain-containing protein [Bacteroides sp.]|uniref:PD-(D/E)XK nuclease domain-containing protein n=1 Tax=Bacteroides sp. TaxID=29523 RepID=UPI0025C73350|nr:PD-(D/E)XK nuclease domain-containing protein [Bacteroides sp.]
MFRNENNKNAKKKIYGLLKHFLMAGTLKQIEEKQYTRAYLTDSRTIIRIGVNFSSKTMTIEEWEETR